MKFICKTNNEEWEGRVTKLVKHTNTYEFWIIGRSSIMVILGSTSRGGFACFPDYRVGCHLVDLKDKFWNTEQLVSVLGKVDGITVSSALTELANEIQI